MKTHQISLFVGIRLRNIINWLNIKINVKMEYNWKILNSNLQVLSINDIRNEPNRLIKI